MRPRLPMLEEVKRHIQADLQRIKNNRYSVDEIYHCLEAYRDRYDSYEKVIQNFSSRIQSARKGCPYVHSVRFRMKDYLHLAEKLVLTCTGERKKKKKKKKGYNITKKILFDCVTDLGGVRIIHLRKDEWKWIHKYLTSGKLKFEDEEWGKWRLEVVDREAFIRPGDRKKFSRMFSLRKIHDDDENKYTSLHYTMQALPEGKVGPDLFIECQVRTLFEEGWGEIDHRLNYPQKGHALVRGQLAALNAAANTANEIAVALETLEHLPLLVPWETEQRFERSALEIHCLTPDLGWVAQYLQDAIEHFKQSYGRFFYYILNRDQAANENYQMVKRKLAEEELLQSGKVQLFRAKSGASVIPLVSDLLFLKKASIPNSGGRGRYSNVAIIGTPSRGEQKVEEKLDMLITEKKNKMALDRLSRFFDNANIIQSFYHE